MLEERTCVGWREKVRAFWRVDTVQRRLSGTGEGLGQLGVCGTGLLEGSEKLLFQVIPRSHPNVDTNGTSI